MEEEERTTHGPVDEGDKPPSRMTIQQQNDGPKEQYLTEGYLSHASPLPYGAGSRSRSCNKARSNFLPKWITTRYFGLLLVVVWQAGILRVGAFLQTQLHCMGTVCSIGET